MRSSTRQKHDGTVWIWLSRLSLFAILAMMIILAGLIALHSFEALWPARLEQVRLADGSELLGVRVNQDLSPDGRVRIQYKVGNRDLYSGADFRWIFEKDIAGRSHPGEAVLVERLENGIFLGYLKGSESGGARIDDTDPARFRQRLDEYRRGWNAEGEPLLLQLAALAEQWQNAHMETLKAEYEQTRAAVPADAEKWKRLAEQCGAREAEIKTESDGTMARLNEVKQRYQGDKALFVDAGGKELAIPLSSVVETSWPNRYGFFDRAGHFAGNIWKLLSQYPREANTEGGLFPALIGTALLVFIMAISAFPLGVAAGIYLREYARDGFLSRTARIAVNNLAGVPSIVYGIFGLGFFIYGLGGGIDHFFFPERVAAGINTYGGGGILWSSLTLGLLTLPVVIVATEEALATVPSEVRQGSLALGATKFQTLWRVILPMASPGVMTGFILAMARAAGEVAPLMLTGAVKSAHSLALDGSWPYIHLERKFMHLGFHIYDMGFQSPNVEASKPLVYLTALVLLVLVFALNFAAIVLRKRMRDKYAMKGF